MRSFKSLIITAILACVLLTPINPVCSQPQKAAAIPATPAGRQMKEWLQVFSGGDQGIFERYIQTHYSKTLLDESPAVDRADRHSRTFLDARSFNLQRIEKSTDHELTLLAQASLTGLWFRLTMKVESNSPYRITEYVAQRIQPPTPPKKLTVRQLIREVDTLMKRLAAFDAFSGTLLIAKDGKPIYQTVAGFASKAHGARNRLDTKLNLASVSKMFTAIAIAQLAEQGKLSYTDTIGKILPDYPNKQVAGKVTIHHLLTHTSGMGDYHGAKYVCQRSLLRETRDYFPLFVDEPLSFEPGARWQYSNAGFIVLGAIIEKVSGENFFDYVQEHIFKPAGMTGTGYYDATVDMPNLAMGYTNFEELPDDNLRFHLGPRRNTSQYGPARGNSQGGAFSTAEDLLRFTLALQGNKLISEKTRDLMTSSKVIARKYDAGQTLWGYGFELENIDGKRVIGHGGGDLGISSGIRMFPDSGNYTLIILSNYDRGGIIANYKIQELIIQNQN